MPERHTAMDPDEIVVTHSSESSRPIIVTDQISITALNVFWIIQNTYFEYSGSP